MYEAPLPAGTAQATFYGTYGATRWQLWSSLFVPFSIPPTFGDVDALRAQVALYFIDVIDGCCTDDTELSALRLVVHTDDGPVESQGAMAVPGSHTTNQAAPVCSVARLETVRSGRGARPLLHLPGVPHAWTIGDAFLSDEGIADTTNRLNAYLDGVQSYTSTAFPVVRVVSFRRRTVDGALPEVGIDFVQGFRVSRKLGTVSHRLRERGERPFVLH